MPAWKGKLWRGVIIHFPSAIPCITIAVTELHHGVITVGLLPLPSSKVNYRFIMLYSFLYATPSLPCFFPDGVEQPSEAAFSEHAAFKLKSIQMKSIRVRQRRLLLVSISEK